MVLRLNVRLVRFVAHSNPARLEMLCPPAENAISAARSAGVNAPDGLLSAARKADSRRASVIVIVAGRVTVSVAIELVAAPLLFVITNR